MLVGRPAPSDVAFVAVAVNDQVNDDAYVNDHVIDTAVPSPQPEQDIAEPGESGVRGHGFGRENTTWGRIVHGSGRRAQGVRGSSTLPLMAAIFSRSA